MENSFSMRSGNRQAYSACPPHWSRIHPQEISYVHGALECVVVGRTRARRQVLLRHNRIATCHTQRRQQPRTDACNIHRWPKLGGSFKDGVPRCVGCVGDVGEACVGDCGDIPGSDVGTEGSVRRFGLEESDDALLSTASPAPASARLRSAMLPPLAVDTVSSLLRLCCK